MLSEGSVRVLKTFYEGSERAEQKIEKNGLPYWIRARGILSITYSYHTDSEQNSG